MHKAGLFIICILFVIMLPAVSFAQSGTTYVLDDVEMEITIPSEFTVFTRDTVADTSMLEAFGLTEEYMRDYMNQNCIYLDAVSSDGLQEIVVTMDESSLPDYGTCDDTELSVACSSIKKELSTLGLICGDHEIYKHAQTKFIKMDISQPNNGSTTYGIEYCTAFGGKAINVTMHSYSGTLSISDRKILQEIVDSVVFLNATKAMSNASIVSNAFEYSDADAGVKFTVPANWKQISLSAERKVVKAKFASTKDDELLILYGNMDVWEQMSASEKAGQTRADYNQATFTKNDIAEMCGVPTADVSTKKYGGYEYYTVPVSTTIDSMGVSITINTIQAIRMGNGYMYQFQFMGSKNNPYYCDFETMLSSAEYEAEDIRTAPVAASKFDNTISNAWESIILSIVITAVVYSLPIVIYRYGIKKTPVEAKQAKKITIIYGIGAFVIMSILISITNGNGAAGGAIVLWSYINYRILTGGHNKDVISDDISVPNGNTTQDDGTLQNASPVKIEATDEPKLAQSEEINSPQTDDIPEIPVSQNTRNDRAEQESCFCYKCGNRLFPGSIFCNKCGAKIR